MQYQFKTFNVVYGSKEYNVGYETIFGKRCDIHNVKLDEHGNCEKCKAVAEHNQDKR